MSELNVTLIDVGWGDSIFIESIDDDNNKYFALIDSNDTTRFRSSHIFLKRYLQRNGISLSEEPLFEFVMLSHAHSDHGQGLKSIIRSFGTKNFYYPKSKNWNGLITLLRYAHRSNSKIDHYQEIDNKIKFPDLGDVAIEILWPPSDKTFSKRQENNNSIVLLLKLGEHSVVLTGDAEEKVWQNIKNKIPVHNTFFKVPHHGSYSGQFNTENSSYLDQLDDPRSSTLNLGISCHNAPYGHPDKQVVKKFKDKGFSLFRTDKHHHLTFWTDGQKAQIKYSGFEDA